MYLSGVMDGTGLGTDVLLVLFELLVPWFCCSDCICSAAEYNVDSFLEHTWARTLARVWDMTIWSTYWKKKKAPEKLKSGLKCKHFFFFFLCASPFQAQPNVDFFVSLFLNTSFYPCPPPPPQIEIALIGQKLNLFVMGKLSESWHTSVCTKMYIYWAVRTKQKPNCTLSKRGIRYFSNKSSAFLLLSNKSNSHWRNSCLSRRLSYKLAK